MADDQDDAPPHVGEAAVEFAKANIEIARRFKLTGREILRAYAMAVQGPIHSFGMEFHCEYCAFNEFGAMAEKAFNDFAAAESATSGRTH